MTLEQIDEHFRSLENHRNAIKVLVARIESEVLLNDGDKAKTQLAECTAAFKSAYTGLDAGVLSLEQAKVKKAKP